MRATRVSLSIIKNFFLVLIFFCSIFLLQSDSFARPVSLKLPTPEAVVSYRELAYGGERIIYKVLDLTHKTVISSQVLQTGTLNPYQQLFHDMAVENRNKTVHIGIFDFGRQTIIYKTVNQAGAITSEIVLPPAFWLSTQGIRKIKLVLWENQNTTIPIIVAGLRNCSPFPCTTDITVLAKINGVWHSAAIPSPLNLMVDEGTDVDVKVDPFTNTAYIAASSAISGGRPVHFLTWNNVSNPASWSFSLTSTVPTTNFVLHNPVRNRIARGGGSSNYLLAINNDMNPTPGREILIHNTQTNSTQSIRQNAVLVDIFEVGPGLMGIATQNYVLGTNPPHSYAMVSQDFSLYVDGVGIINSFLLQSFSPFSNPPPIVVNTGPFLAFAKNSSPTSPKLYLANLCARQYTVSPFTTLSIFVKIYTITNVSALTDTWEVPMIPTPGGSSGYDDIKFLVY